MKAPAKDVIAKAPGKIILSGEHSVVYGRPALVQAVGRSATAHCSQAPSEGIIVRLPDIMRAGAGSLDTHFSIPAADFATVRRRLQQRHQRFLAGRLKSAEIVTDPADLSMYALALILERAAKASRMLLTVHSSIPSGAGMGSSAAVSAAVIAGAAAYLGIELNPDDLLALVIEAEKIQHGRPSGIDPYATVYGGLTLFRKDSPRRLQRSLGEMTLVNTGTPLSSTGECVEHVAAHYADSSIWDDFAAVTADMQRALESNDQPLLQHCVRRNHHLLDRIGVVPPRVRDFISRVERGGGAAKICGAGAVRGPSAGMVWLLGGHNTVALCAEFGYTLMTVKGTSHGVRILQGQRPGQSDAAG